MVATFQLATPCSANTSFARSTIQATLRSAPAIPELPKISGQSLADAAATMCVKSALTASRSKYWVPVPRK